MRIVFVTVPLLVSLSACATGPSAIPAQARTTVAASTEDFKPVPTLIATPQVAKASQAQRDLLNSEAMKQLVDEELVREVVVDSSTVPPSLEVNVKAGIYNGTDSASYVQARLPRIYEGIPVRISSESPDKAMPAFDFLSKPPDTPKK